MRKILAFLVLLMLPWVARGQALADCYYWFDQDVVPQKSGKVGELKFQLQPDVSHLKTGLHTLYVQVVDTAGIYSTPVGTTFYKVSTNTEISEFRYWFDSDGTVRTMPYRQGQYVLDVAHLSPGFHFINYYMTDGEENMTQIESVGFFRVPVESNQKLYYWFTGDTVATHVPNYRDGFIVDVTRLHEGFNTIHFQIDDNGPANFMEEYFIKIPQTENAGDMTLVCIIDGKVVGEEKVAAHGGVVRCNMDVSKIDVGLHKAMFQLVTASGIGSSIAETYFIRTLTNDDIGSMQCSYTIDGFRHRVHKGTSSNGVFHFDLPVDEVEDGLHRIDFMLVSENGASTTQGNAWFFKTPVGGNAITQYDYWLNDKYDEVQSVTLEEPKDPFQLIKLLPVSAEPIRSSCFHFEAKNDKPMVYAKNDIHFRFHDKSGRWVDNDKQYIDYNVSREITNLADLMPSQTFERPEENGIKWFKFEAEEGDTIAFRCSQATSLQVFAPSGDEIYSAAGNKAVQYDGAHTWENGTYYVAIHDVTGSRTDVTLDYMHMDRYDVVDQDVKVVGNGGCSTITFQGNGFKDLYKVELYNAQGDTIRNAHIDYLSDASVAVRFNFTYAALGEYAAIFYFTEEEKKFNSCVVVEEAEDIMLSYDVIYASSFLRGTANTYTIKVKNSGNSTAYQVPLKIQLQANGGTNNITYIKLSDNLCFDDYTWLNDDSIPEKERLGLVELVHQKGNMLDFITINDIATQEEFMEGYFAINLPPCSTTTFTISVKSDSEVTVYTLLPDEWDYYAYTETAFAKSNRRIRKASVKESMCCARTHVECAMNILASGLDYASLAGGSLAIASCIASVANTVIPFAYDMWCSETSNDKDEAMKSLYRNIISSIISCASKYDPYKIGWMIQHVNDVITTTMSCVSNPKQLPNCPPKPPKPHPSNPVNSLDPNDIYGYLSESGSKFVADSIATLNYRIEFENDTTFATASAHTVIVKDTLDATKYDLSSYKPTSIKIGDKDVLLNGDKQFVTTVDMRPSINAIAQVEGLYDEKKGIATWKFISLDPMTMEETDDVMQGFLPINFDGNGIGEVAFNIDRLPNLADGTQISNKASIVFDTNDAILTPVWTNTIDAVAPTSKVTDVEMKNDSTFSIHFAGEDDRSGIWKYDVYYRWKTDMDWICIANGCDSTAFDKTAVAGYTYQFCVVATDSAGNVEQKLLTPEFEFSTSDKLGDVNQDGKVDVTDIAIIVSIINGNALSGYKADIDNDGDVDIDDLNKLIELILKK